MNGVAHYFDDIVVYGSTKEEHDKNLEAVMNKFQEKGLIELGAKDYMQVTMENEKLKSENRKLLARI